MDIIVKLDFRRRFVFYVLDGEKRRKKEIISVSTLFKTIQKRIAEREGVCDFSFWDSDRVHARWFAFDDNNDFCEYDFSVTLDDSVLKDEKIMHRLREFEKEFIADKESYQEEYFKLLSKYSRDQKLKDKAFSHLRKYIEYPRSPLFGDDEDFEDMVAWLKKNKDEVVYSDRKLATACERSVLALLNGANILLFINSMGKFLIGNLASFIMYSSTNMDLSAIPGLGCVFVLVSMYFNFKYVSNERTYRNFLSDLEDYEEEQKSMIRESRGIEYEKPDTLMRRFVIREKAFLDRQDIKAENVKKELDRLLRPTAEEDVVTHLKNLECLTYLERVIHSGEEDRIGAKAEVASPFGHDVLKERLLYIGFSGVQIDEDPFIFTLSDTILKLKSYPFYGVELEIVRLIEVGVDYAKAFIKYGSLMELVHSQDYAELLERRNAICVAALSAQERIKRVESLISSLEDLVNAVDHSTREEWEHSYDMLVAEASKSLLFRPVEKFGDHI